MDYIVKSRFRRGGKYYTNGDKITLSKADLDKFAAKKHLYLIEPAATPETKPAPAPVADAKTQNSTNSKNRSYKK